MVLRKLADKILHGAGDDFKSQRIEDALEVHYLIFKSMF